MERLIKGEHDWHEKINNNFDEVSDGLNKTTVVVKVDEAINKEKWYEVISQDLTNYAEDEAVNLTLIVNNGAGMQLGLLNIKLEYTEGVLTPYIVWSYANSAVDMNDYCIEVVDRKWRLCTFIKTTEMVKTFELIARSSKYQVGFPLNFPGLTYEPVVTRYISGDLTTPLLSSGGTDASAIVYGNKSVKTVLDDLNSSLIVSTRSMAGGTLDINIVTYGKLRQIRASAYTKRELLSGSTYTINQVIENFVHSVNRRYTLNPNTDFVVDIAIDGTIKITPTATIPTNTAINFSEFMLLAPQQS